MEFDKTFCTTTQNFGADFHALESALLPYAVGGGAMLPLQQPETPRRRVREGLFRLPVKLI